MFDGEGARLHGGRWNGPDTPIVYTSSTLALAALELFVQLTDPDLTGDLVATPAGIPAGVTVSRVRLSDLPENWRQYPAPEMLRDLGTRWAQGGRTAVLTVPSAVIPAELNYLLNPRHPGFRRIRLGAFEPFRFDPRTSKPVRP